MVIMNTSKQYHIVSASQLPNFVGKNVALLGVVTDTAFTGSTCFTINATDSLNVSVRLNKPLSEELNSGSYVEVRGTCEGASSERKLIRGEEFFTFNNKSFDAKSHTTLCKLINSVPNIYSAKK